MVELSVAVTTDAREKKQTEREVEEMAKIYERCQRLYFHWKEDVVNKSSEKWIWPTGEETIKLVEYLATSIAEYAKSAPSINELVRV